ncbi:MULTISPECIES: alpha/beta fold hydrolase [unclassified Nocardia]|uniref:alpha/beta fold hydrolase n=1 Tax=unclassified Nocardia TaxID=2637762 RepID=UPI001CE3D0F2|nr:MULTISPECIES: alpha/beta hydrolase [unclassified Nocardia]
MTSTEIRPQPLTVHTGDGLRLDATEIPSPTPAVTVVYLHGLLADQSFWQPVIEVATPRISSHASQIAYDARGHGASEWPARHNDTDFAVLADDLATVIDTLPGPVVLVAHSIGCYTVLEHAKRHRSQLCRVSEIVLFAAAGEEPLWPALRSLRPAAAGLRWMRRRGPLDAVNAAGHAYLAARLRSMAAHAKPGRAQLIPSMHPVDPRVTADICTAVTTFQVGYPLLRELTGVPVRLVTAEFDRVIPPAQTHQLAARMPDAIIDHVATAGHSLPLSDPGRAAAVVEAAVASFSPRRHEITVPNLPVAQAGE